MSAHEPVTEVPTVAWLLTIRGLHVDNRLAPDGVVGVIQPVVIIEPSEAMTDKEEASQWQSFMSACGRDSLSGDRLLMLQIETPINDQPARLTMIHIAATHAFDIPAAEWTEFEKLTQLVSVPVLYSFRSRPVLEYKALIEVDGAEIGSVASGEGPEFWVSRFGRGSRPKAHMNAMHPVSRNLINDASPPTDVFALDLAKFAMPASDNCVICAEPLGDEVKNREHLVPAWLRTLVSDHLGVPVAGVVAEAHEACNRLHGPDEEVVRALTRRHLSGEDLSNEELSAVAYWMAGRMTLIDRAAGIQVPSTPPRDSSFQSTRTPLSPLYSGRLGDDDTPPFRTLVLGPWIYHCCWSEEGCGASMSSDDAAH